MVYSNDYEGPCRVCDFEYRYAREETWGDIRDRYTIDIPCRKCFYSPGLQRVVNDSVSSGLGARIVQGKMGFCFEGVSNFILNYLENYFDKLKECDSQRSLGILKDISKRVPLVIEENIEGDFGSDGRLHFNTHDLADLVFKELINIWKEHK